MLRVHRQQFDTKMCRWLSVRAGSSSNEILWQNRPGQSPANLVCVADPGKTNDERASRLTKVVRVVDQSIARPDRSWPGPCAHPDDRQCEWLPPCRLKGSPSDSRGGKAPA